MNTRFKWLAAVAAADAPEGLKTMLWPLAYHADENGVSWPAVATLAHEAGIASKRTAQRRLKKLENLKLIAIERQTAPIQSKTGTLFCNRYRLLLDAGRGDRVMSCRQGQRGDNPDQRGDKIGGDGVTNQVNGVTELCHPNPNRNTNKPIRNPAGEALNIQCSRNRNQNPRPFDINDPSTYGPDLTYCKTILSLSKTGRELWDDHTMLSRKFAGKTINGQDIADLALGIINKSLDAAKQAKGEP